MSRFLRTLLASTISMTIIEVLYAAYASHYLDIDVNFKNVFTIALFMLSTIITFTLTTGLLISAVSAIIDRVIDR